MVKIKGFSMYNIHVYTIYVNILCNVTQQYLNIFIQVFQLRCSRALGSTIVLSFHITLSLVEWAQKNNWALEFAIYSL